MLFRSLAIAVPTIVDAQDARIRAEQVTVVGDNGADRVKLGVGPGVNAEVDVFDADGLRRASLNTGGFRFGNDPESAGFNAFGPDGATQVVRLGIGRGPLGDQPLFNTLILSDLQGKPRITMRVEEDGTPSMRLLDAAGNVTWNAP